MFHSVEFHSSIWIKHWWRLYLPAAVQRQFNSSCDNSPCQTLAVICWYNSSPNLHFYQKEQMFWTFWCRWHLNTHTPSFVFVLLLLLWLWLRIWEGFSPENNLREKSIKKKWIALIITMGNATFLKTLHSPLRILRRPFSRIKLHNAETLFRIRAGQIL